MKSNLATYLAPLAALVLATMLATAYLCWNLRDVQTDLAESRWIFFGIFAHLQVWAIGVPLLLIAEDTSRDVSYIMSSSLCFVFSTMLVCSVIWPKIFAWWREKYYGNEPTQRINVNTTGKASTMISGLTLPAQKSSPVVSANLTSTSGGEHSGGTLQSKSAGCGIEPVEEELAESSDASLEAKVETAPATPVVRK